MLGIALLATVAVASIGVVPATADETVVLCQVNKEACKEKDSAGEGFTATAATSFNFGGLGTFACSSTMIRFAPALSIKGLSFAKCTEGCAVNVENLPYSSELLNPSGGNGTVRIANGGSGEPKLAVECGGVKCVYGIGTLEAKLEGGKPAAIAVTKSLTGLTESFFCPKVAEWNAKYTVTSPTTGVFMAKRAIEGPVFCEVNEAICPQKSIVEYFIVGLKPASNFHLEELVGGPVDCEGTGFGLLDTTNPFGAGPFDYKAFAIAECTHPIYTGCTVDREYVTLAAHLFPWGGGDGEVSVVEGASKEAPALRIECTAGSPFSCLYSAEEIWLVFEGGEPAVVYESAWMERVEGSATFCPAGLEVLATYEDPLTPTNSPDLYLTES